jgi:elongation factor Ts
MQISEHNAAILEVRRRTQDSIGECKKSLMESNWEIDEAIRLMARNRHNANNKSHESYGYVALYSYEFGRAGVIVELGCESGYVAKSMDFVKLANTIAIHVAWSNPKGMDRKDVNQSFGEICLLDQPEMRETQGQRTIREMLSELSCKTGETITLVRFARFKVGE